MKEHEIRPKALVARYVELSNADESNAVAVQRFLTEQRLSSHVWVIGQKSMG
jgi:hypothetical protein